MSDNEAQNKRRLTARRPLQFLQKTQTLRPAIKAKGVVEGHFYFAAIFICVERGGY
jgi:hypothetical protein